MYYYLLKHLKKYSQTSLENKLFFKEFKCNVFPDKIFPYWLNSSLDWNFEFLHSTCFTNLQYGNVPGTRFPEMKIFMLRYLH